MALKDTMQAKLMEAMKQKDETTVLVLRLVKTAIMRFETAGEKKVATDDDVIQIIGKEIKQRKDSIEQFEKGGRSDLADKEHAEMKVLETFLPEQLSEEDVKKMVQEAIATLNATSKSDLGKVMAALTPRTKGRADGALVSRLVREMLP